MIRYVATLLFSLSPLLCIAQDIPDKISESEFSIGKSIQIQSTLLGEARDLNIYLPSNYETNKDQSYPVIYLLDGSIDEDIIHIAGIAQFAAFPWINIIPESIVVGIGNVDRKRDFTPPSQNELDQKEFPTSGGASNFVQFIEKEIQPFIENNFRVTNQKTLIGQSLGGLLATHVLFTQPHLFDNYIIVSPSLWWNDEKLLDASIASYQSEKSIYIAVGKEGEVMERTARELYEKLLSTQSNHSQVYFEFLEDKTHGDALHIAVYHALEVMFKQQKD